MKKITFILSLVSASLTVTAASAADQNSERIVNLPAYKVSAARYTDAEKAIERNLAALRAKAQPAAIATELPSLNTVVQPAAPAGDANLAKVAAQPVPTRS